MRIPTEPIGSIPRTPRLIEALTRVGGAHPSLEPIYDEATRETIERFEATGSPGAHTCPGSGRDSTHSGDVDDDCGFSPFCDDTSTSRDTAFEKIRARVIGTELASEILGGQ